MAYKYNIQYVNFYTHGSAAKKIAPVQSAPKVTLPKPKKRKRKVIFVDPVAILGIAVAVCMLVMMFVGLGQLQKERENAQKMYEYATYLDNRNQELSVQYRENCDLEEVERTAVAMGMKPQDQVPQTVVHIPAQTPEQADTQPQKVTLLTQLYTILSGYFA